jgi:hypothetical protein
MTRSFSGHHVEFSLDPLKVAIARLSDSDFSRMNRDDLIHLVSYAVLDGMSFESQARLDFIDDFQLKRLAYLARLACQRKVNSVFFERGRRCPFFDFA